MNIGKIVKYSLMILIACQGISLMALMEPIKKDGRYYYSPEDTHQHINLAKGLLFFGKKIISPEAWIKRISSIFYPVQKEPYNAVALLNPTQTVPAQESIEPKITWIGHASFLIQINGFNVLTDPIFGHVKVGPFTLTKRSIEPGIKLEDLPPIDAIVISHNHSDHTDTNTLKALAQKYNPVVYVPEGNKSLFESMGFSHIVENTWWDAQELTKNGRNLKITCLPAYHWSIRFSLGSYRKSLWSSWMMSTNDKNIYFAGDTAYGKHFKEIGEQFPSIDVALMPIAPTGEKGVENKHKLYHVDAPEAVNAYIDLRAHYFVPMHYGTFFGEEHIKYPLERLHEYWQEKSLDFDRLLIARCGQEYTI